MCDCEGAFLNGGFFLTPITGSIGIFDAARIESDRTMPLTCLPDVDGIDVDDNVTDDVVADAFEIFL